VEARVFRIEIEQSSGVINEKGEVRVQHDAERCAIARRIAGRLLGFRFLLGFARM
jgi:hypothetical protein